MQSISYGLSSIAGLVGGFFRWPFSVRWPLSVKIMIGVGVLFLLQAFPYTGIFLMMMAAPLWSVPLINLAVIVAGVEGAIGRAPRWFILVPICWFGVYTLAVMRDEAALVKAEEMVATANAAAKPITYDPARHDVVTDETGKFVDKLLLGYRLPVVYSKRSRGRDRAMKASRLAIGPVCETLKNRKVGAKVHVRKIHKTTARHHGLPQSVPLCVVRFNEEPAREVIQVRKQKTVEDVDGLAVQMMTISAEADGRRSEIRGASAAILPTLPMPGLGCALNSGAPSWDCYAQFIRRPRVWFGTKTDDNKALAMALDLSRVEPARLDEASNAAIGARLADADKVLDRHRGNLVVDFLKNPAEFSRGHEVFRQFENDPDKLAPFADRLITALEKADAHERLTGEKAYKTGVSIARLVAQLPDAEIQRNAARIINVLDGPVRSWHAKARPLMRRTAVLGTDALPMLTARLERSARRSKISWPAANAIIALCRMGLPAAAAAGPQLLDIWHKRNAMQTSVVRRGPDKGMEVIRKPSLGRHDRFLYLALMRLGLGDHARDADPRGSVKWWRKTRQIVTPQSPADVCEQAR